MKLETKKGWISGINLRRYFGFIVDESGENHFFHGSGVICPDFEQLKAGMPVEFFVVQVMQGEQQRSKAIGVSVIDQALIKSEVAE